MRIPKYRRHPNGQAFVQHKSVPTKDRRQYLGKYGSDESKRKYDQFVKRLLASRKPQDTESVPQPTAIPTINELAVAFLDHAEEYYAHSNKEFSNTKMAIVPLVELYGDELASEFGPLSLAKVREHLIKQGYVRLVVNRRVGVIKRLFKWCASQEMIPANLYHALQTLDGLRAGKSGVKESEPVRPAVAEHVKAILPFVSPTVAGMIQVQYLCGMRPGEVCILRQSDIDTTRDIWIYTPSQHKTAWRGKSLFKAIPLAAQAILAGFFTDNDNAFLFSPRDSDAWHRANRLSVTRKKRKTPIYPSEIRRREKRRGQDVRKSNREIGEHFTTSSYSKSVKAGFERAKKSDVEIPYWTPNQLRHSIATDVAQAISEQAAQRWLGHDRLDTTRIYAERDINELVDIARQLDLIWESQP